MSRHLLWLAAAIVAPSATGQQAACDWASFGTGSADVNNGGAQVCSVDYTHAAQQCPPGKQCPPSDLPLR